MTTSVNCWTGEFRDTQDKEFMIPEAACWKQALTVIPVIGHALQCYAEMGLQEQLDQPNIIFTDVFKREISNSSSSRRDRDIKCVQVANEYKAIGIARDLIIAIVVLATSLLLALSPIAGVILSLLFLGKILNAGYQIYQNNETLKQLEKSKISPPTS